MDETSRVNLHFAWPDGSRTLTYKQINDLCGERLTLLGALSLIEGDDFREEIGWLATDATCLASALGEALSEMAEPGKVPVQKFMHRYVDHSCLVTHARALRGVVSMSGHSGDADPDTMEKFAQLLESELEHLFAEEDDENETIDSFAASSLFNTIAFAVPDGRLADFEEAARANRCELEALFEKFLEKHSGS